MNPLVVVDVRTVLGQFTGIGRYALSLVPLMIRARPDWRFHLFVAAGSEPLFAHLGDRCTVEAAPPVPQHPASDWWLHVTLPAWLRQHEASLFFSAANYLPIQSGGAKRVVTIHDLVPYRFPGLDPLKFVLYLRANLRLCSWVADAIVAVSRNTAKEVEQILAAPRDRVHVVHNGVGSEFRKLSAEELATVLASRPNIAALEPGFLLSVGTHTPRKNFSRLIAAIAKLQTRVPLVLAGPSGQALRLARTEARTQGVEERVRFIDYPDDTGLVALYNMAGLFVFPALYEGFGIPMLEAMGCGTPVAASSSSCLPEVAGDQAEYFDPTSTEDMARVINRVLTDDTLRNRLSREGPGRAASFTWQSAAESTCRVLEGVLE